MQVFRVNNFNFEYLGKMHTGSYSFSDSLDGVPNLSLDQNNERRGREMDLNFILNLQYPAFDYYDSKTMLDATNKIKIFKHFADTQNTFDELTTTLQDQDIEKDNNC